eukprot:CAMPEP_0175131614 /NCGR_PEP_ID=MMETSP0087-20121206/6639_1 /TAXON_ID=136419 /ORGANISM="Unknown Unknown, Strain D1" /LENGTH=449 /DNA_ID=CAMNT_0016413921 /DNA_START=83 /DNA_END=1432 /DNA_ORIENTATION=+
MTHSPFVALCCLLGVVTSVPVSKQQAAILPRDGGAYVAHDVSNVEVADNGAATVALTVTNHVSYEIVGVNVTLLTIILLTFYFWKVPEKESQPSCLVCRKEKSLSSNDTADAGKVMGDYSADWKRTFDLALLGITLAMLIVLLIVTAYVEPELFNSTFFLMQIPKLLILAGSGTVGGMVVRHFNKIDEKGYIITTTKSKFKVNYTRKIQHFVAYILPVLSRHSHTLNPLHHIWSSWITILYFTLLIKPIRERSKLFMLQFNALDRPEDRPHTQAWVVAGNIIPGLVCLLFWQYMFSKTNQEGLVLIILFICSFGDGLAEPVGLAFGKHKYWARALFSKRMYRRSFEGSACVFFFTAVFCSVWVSQFHSVTEYWIAMLVMPPLMTVAEAFSPHSMDTFFLLGFGGLALWIITHSGLSDKSLPQHSFAALASTSEVAQQYFGGVQASFDAW